MNRNTKQRVAAARKAGNYTHGRAVNSSLERSRKSANLPRIEKHPYVTAWEQVLIAKNLLQSTVR
jgi:hypothetical protein